MHANTRVIACIDGSALTPAVCDYAAWIAQRVTAPLKLLHTIDHHPEIAIAADLSGNIGLDSRDHLLEELSQIEQRRSKLRLQQGKSLLQSATERVIQSGVADPIASQRHGSLVEALIELEENIRVLVIGVRGKVHENHPGQIGAKLESIIRSLHKPILVVNEAFRAPQRIMIAYDGSDAAEKAVEMVSTSPLFKGLSCHLVWSGKDDPATNQRFEATADTLAHSDFSEVVVQKLPGKPEQSLCAYQDQQSIDLTVMGAFRHTRIHDWLLGSFTVKMLAHAHKPLLLLR